MIKKTLRKTWVTIIIFSLIVVGGIFAFQNLRQSRSGFPGWKIYTNKDYEIQHPEDWSVNVTESYGDVELYPTFFSDNYQEIESEEWKETVARGEEPYLLPRNEVVTGTRLYISFRKITDDPDWTWKEWATGPGSYPPGELVNYDFIFIDNREIHRQEVKYNNITYLTFSLPNPDRTRLYELYFYTAEKDQQTFNQILSSLKFFQ